MKPEIQIIASSNDGDPNYTYLIDPNPEKNVIFNPEDYFIYVNLTAYPKARTFINVDDFDVRNNGNNKKISFIKTTSQNGENYTTTNYIETDGERFNQEGFGIKEISINLKNNFVPTVDVTFFDTKSSNINNYENDDNSPFSAFFSLPYPLFKLTIKGYYGKPVEYCLHLMKFNSSFDSNTGGFISKASFMGYSYAFFADIPLKYVYAIGNSPQGQELLAARGSISLSQQMANYAKISRFVESEKINNEDYSNYIQLNNLLNEVNDFNKTIGFIKPDEDKTIIGDDLSINVPHLVYRDIVIFKSTFNATFLTYVKELNEFIKSINKKLIRFELNQEIDVVNFVGLLVNKEFVVNKIKADFQSLYSAEVLKGLDNPLSDVDFDFIEGQEYNFISLYQLRTQIAALSEYLNEQVEINNKEIKSQINNKVLDNFNSTLYDYYKVLADNIEVFCELLYKSAASASSANIQGKRKRLFSGYTSDIIDDNIYPYPAIVIDEEYAWLGDIKNSDSIVFPEMNFIKLLINSLLDVNSIDNNINTIESIFNNQVRQSSIFPISPYDVNNNNLLDIVLNPTDLDQMILNIYNRYAVLKYSKYVIDDNEYDWSKVEAFNIREVLDDNILKLIAYNSIDDNIGIIDQTYEVFNDGNVINPEINFITLNQSSSYESSSLNPLLFDSIDQRSLVVSPQFRDFINTDNVKKSLLGFTNDTDLVFTNQFYFFKKKNNLSFYTRDIISYFNQNGGLQNLQTLYPVISKQNTFREDFQIGFNFYQSEFAFIKDNNYTNNDDKIFKLLSHFYFSPYIVEALNSLVNSDKAVLTEIPLLYLIWVYSIYLTDSNTIFSANIPNEDIILSEQPTIISLINSRPELGNLLKNIYDTYSYRILFLVEEFNSSLESDNKGIKLNSSQQNIYNNILNEYKKNEYVIVPANYTNNFVVNKSDFIRYYKTLQKEIKILLKESVQTNTSYEDIILKDRDFLIEIYNDIKSFYDKWVSLGIDKGSVFNVCFNSSRNLIDHFYFIDRSWGNIGDKVVINPRTILNNMKNPRVSCYQHITSVLNDNNFQVFIAPTYIGFRNKDDVEDMFVPQTSLDNAESTPSLIAMYIGGYSTQTVGNTNHKSDGFNLNTVEVPQDFSNRKRSTLHNSSIDFNKYNLISFLVNIGDNNQSHFIDLDVSTEEHQNTAEYLKTLSEIVDKGGATKKFYKGVDLYDLFKLRSFTATVKSMGNMMIQPFQYFQINVPMFKGAYIITSVSHQLTPHHHLTTFKGQKISKFRYPLVTEITSYLDLTNYQLADAATSQFINENLNEDSEGLDFINNTVNVVGNYSNNILLNITRNNVVAVSYVISDDLSSNVLDERLRAIFINDASKMDTYGLRGAKCMSWVKNLLLDIGIRSTPFGGVHAWEFFAGLNNSRLKYFNPALSTATSKLYDYNAEIDDKLAIVMGYFKNSGYQNDAARIILAANDPIKIENLKNFKNFSRADITPITHIGIVYNGVFYDFAGGRVRIGVKTSFVPVCYVPIYNLLKSKL